MPENFRKNNILYFKQTKIMPKEAVAKQLEEEISCAEYAASIGMEVFRLEGKRLKLVRR